MADDSPSLERRLGLAPAVALNVTGIVGAGVFITIPLMLLELPGPYALLGWIVAALLMLLDGTVWGELGASFPGSGGSYLYLREGFGSKRWGKLTGFLFLWQFLLSGPLETSSGLIAIAQFSKALAPEWTEWARQHTHRVPLIEGTGIALEIGPHRAIGFGLGFLLIILAYRTIDVLGRLTVTFWLGVLGAIFWIVIAGVAHFDSSVAFDVKGIEFSSPGQFAQGLGATMMLAMYSYLGYYNVCYIGDEVRSPGKTIPRAIFLSALLVSALFVALHLSMLGTISWREAPTERPAVDEYNLPVEFMTRVQGPWAARLLAALLIWSCLGSAFSQLVSYSRIPFGAARRGEFFAVFSSVHPRLHIPHVSLMMVGALTLAWSFFDLSTVISALLVTRILEQFIGQIIALWLLRARQPDVPRPFRIWLYPVPSVLALAGWCYIYLMSGRAFILLGLVTTALGLVAFLAWSWGRRQWPFEFVDA